MWEYHRGGVAVSEPSAATHDKVATAAGEQSSVNGASELPNCLPHSLHLRHSGSGLLIQLSKRDVLSPESLEINPVSFLQFQGQCLQFQIVCQRPWWIQRPIDIYHSVVWRKMATLTLAESEGV